jgi:hypothetical protein
MPRGRTFRAGHVASARERAGGERADEARAQHRARRAQPVNHKRSLRVPPMQSGVSAQNSSANHARRSSTRQ